MARSSIRDEASGAVRRGKASGSNRSRTAEQVDDDPVELGRGIPAADRERIRKQLDDAARLFSAERYGDAARILKRTIDSAPNLAAARELYGLTLYRQGRWKLAAAELETFHSLTGSVEQNPVLADCYRALRRWRRVSELWEELRDASPSAELVTEGRIVAAGALADQDDLPGAIKMLGRDWRLPKRSKEHHLRRAYALADLNERAGDLPRAREMFSRIREIDPSFADVAERLRGL